MSAKELNREIVKKFLYMLYVCAVCFVLMDTLPFQVVSGDEVMGITHGLLLINSLLLYGWLVLTTVGVAFTNRIHISMGISKNDFSDEEAIFRFDNFLTLILCLLTPIVFYGPTESALILFMSIMAFSAFLTGKANKLSGAKL